MARKNYQTKLDDLQADVNEMATLTMKRHEMAVDVLSTGDSEQAQRVIRGDGDINELYLDLETNCIDLIALQQPVAGDLRFIASSFKIITDLERIGDLATNLAAYGESSNGQVADELDLEPIVAHAGQMVRDAMAAYDSESASSAREVAARDGHLDELCTTASEQIVRELVEEGVEAGAVDDRLAQISRALLTIRDLERIGDHAVNICARTLYMIENDDELIY